MSTSESGTNRREFLAAGSIGAAILLAGGKARAADDKLTAAETANEKVVNDFCAAWESMDVEKIGSYLDDDVSFRMIDTAPVVEGKDKVVAGFPAFFERLDSARFEMLRSVAMGTVVVNDRIDHFHHKDGKKDAYHITGVFVVKGGKIVEWRDYLLPTA